MRNLRRYCLGFLITSAWTLAMAQIAEVRDPVLLKATQDDGVPAHLALEGTNRFFRVSDSAAGNVLSVNDDNGWLELEFEGGQSGWIRARYLNSGNPASAMRESPSGERAAQRVWSSLEGFIYIVNAGR